MRRSRRRSPSPISWQRSGGNRHPAPRLLSRWGLPPFAARPSSALTPVPEPPRSQLPSPTHWTPSDAPGRSWIWLRRRTPSPPRSARWTPGCRAGGRGDEGRLQVLRRRTHEAEAPKFSSDLVVDGRMESLKSRVLVCRATLPSVRRADADLPDGAVLAVVGCSRWPKVVAASLGPTLQRAMSDGRIVFFPHDRDLELNGVDAEPLPSSARAAGRHVIELLWPDLVGPSAPHRWKGRRR